MRIKGKFLFLFAAFSAALATHGQTPPPNDNYSNRIALTGTDLTFTGTLTGATLEDSQEAVSYNNAFSGYGGATPASGSVWWSWTAPQSTALTIEVIGPPPGYFYTGGAAIAIYNATNGSSSPDGLVLPPLAMQFIIYQVTAQSLSIPVTAGTEYEIQLIGYGSGSYSARLISTNTPVIIQQPRSRTVYSNATALFYVLAASIDQTTLAFQWLRDGSPLSGETTPMLAISNIDTSLAGAYSVIVSNSAGATISDPATLAVSQSNVPISLAVNRFQSNSFMFSLTGENGRSYRIEFSTNLITWSPAAEFFLLPLEFAKTSVVFNSNSPLDLAVAGNVPSKFIRASPYVVSPQSADICVNHLEEINVAKLLWERDTNAPAFATPAVSDLLPYLPRHLAPFCPLDTSQTFATSYTINDLQTVPGCLIVSSAHMLEEPR